MKETDGVAREGVSCVAESGYEEAPDCALRRGGGHLAVRRAACGLGDMLCAGIGTRPFRVGRPSDRNESVRKMSRLEGLSVLTCSRGSSAQSRVQYIDGLSARETRA